MTRELLKIYTIWAWRVPYKKRFAILMAVVVDGKVISGPTAIDTASDILVLQKNLAEQGFVKLMPPAGDHPSLMELWI